MWGPSSGISHRASPQLESSLLLVVGMRIFWSRVFGSGYSSWPGLGHHWRQHHWLQQHWRSTDCIDLGTITNGQLPVKIGPFWGGFALINHHLQGPCHMMLLCFTQIRAILKAYIQMWLMDWTNFGTSWDGFGWFRHCEKLEINMWKILYVLNGRFSMLRQHILKAF